MVNDLQMTKERDYYICYVCHLAVTGIEEENMTKQIDALRTNLFFIDDIFTYR